MAILHRAHPRPIVSSLSAGSTVYDCSYGNCGEVNCKGLDIVVQNCSNDNMRQEVSGYASFKFGGGDFALCVPCAGAALQADAAAGSYLSK
eukprot:3862705-Pleurochrysis_carterae.AAC.2